MERRFGDAPFVIWDRRWGADLIEGESGAEGDSKRLSLIGMRGSIHLHHATKTDSVGASQGSDAIAVGGFEVVARVAAPRAATQDKPILRRLVKVLAPFTNIPA